MNREKEIRNIGQLIVLHLFPGVLLSLVYILFTKIGILSEYPKIIIIYISGFLTIIPLELAYLFYVAKKEEGSYNIFKILGLKNKLKIKEYLIYTILLFLITALLITSLAPLTDLIEKKVFYWIPSWYKFTQDMSQFSKQVMMVTILLTFLFSTLIGPIVEELYFRGFLLSRMKWMGKYSVLLNVVLFSVYHFWTPWLIMTRIIAMLPLFYWVKKKNSLRLAIFVHCLLNLGDVIAFATLL